MKKLKKLLTALAVALSFCGTLFAAGSDYMSENQDVRLQNFFAKIRRGENVTVVALGGSITTGFNANPAASNGWAGKTGTWLKELAGQNGSTLTFLNQGVSGTDSAFAIARLDDHVISKNPDLVLLEYAMNDQWLETKTRKRTYEAIIRKILEKTDSAILALFVNERKAPFSSNQAEQQKICEYYHIPFVSWKDCLFATDKKDFEGFFDGEETVHPNDVDHAKIAEYMTAKLENVWKNLPADSEISKISKNLPEVLTDRGFENAVYYTKDNIQPLINTGWTDGSPVHSEWTAHGKSHEGWQTKNAGAEIVFEVTGSAVGITYCESDQFRDPIAWVEYEDGKTSTKLPLNCYVSYRKGYYGWAYKELVSTDTVQKFKVHIQCNKRASKDKNGKSTNITGILVAGEK